MTKQVEKKKGSEALATALNAWVDMACISRDVDMAKMGLVDRVLPSNSAMVFKSWMDAVVYAAKRHNPSVKVNSSYSAPSRNEHDPRKNRLWHEFVLTCEKDGARVEVCIWLDQSGFLSTFIEEAPKVPVPTPELSATVAQVTTGVNQGVPMEAWPA